MRLRSGLVRPAGLVVVAALYLAGGAAIARGATFEVTRKGDPSPGTCKPGDCSLREAVIAANNGSGSDTVELGAHTYHLLIEGDGEDLSATGDLDVTNDLKIKGAGPGKTVIDGDWATDPDRILAVLGSGTALKASGLAVRHGDVGSDEGAGIYVDTDALLVLTRAAVNSNNAQYSTAIDDYGTARLNRVKIAHNVASFAGSGCCPGLYDSGKATLRNVIFSDNVAHDDTGAMYVSGATADLKNVTFARNTAGDCCGGALIPSGGTTNLTNVTFSGNSTDGNGGAIYVESSTQTVNLNNVTIAGNTADSDIAGGGDGGGLYRDSFAGVVVNIKNSIIADNADLSGGAPDCSQASGDAFNSAGHNLIGDGTGCTFTAAGSDLLGVDPKLKPLADNGGFTPTRALRKGSEAIDHGSGKRPGSGGNACAARDQRGVKRPQGPRCDISAYEREKP